LIKLENVSWKVILIINLICYIILALQFFTVVIHYLTLLNMAVYFTKCSLATEIISSLIVTK
jgi:hypothetical protein